MNVLFVCLGNICRSPIAEGIFDKLQKEKNLNWRSDSAGTSGWHIDEKPDRRSIQIAIQNGVDLSKQRSRKLKSSDFKEFDYIIAMDKSNFNNILSIQPDESISKIKLLRTFDTIDTDADVPDPYYGGDEGFRNCFEMIERSCINLIDHIQKESE